MTWWSVYSHTFFVQEQNTKMIEIGFVYKVYMTQCNLSKNYFKTNSIHLLFFGREGEIEVPRHRYRTCALLKLSCIATLKKSCKHDHLFFSNVVTSLPSFPQNFHKVSIIFSWTYIHTHVVTYIQYISSWLIIFIASCL